MKTQKLLFLLVLVLLSIAASGQVTGIYSTTSVTEASADTYTASVAPLTITSYTNKRFTVQFPDDNDGPATINISSLGARTIKKNVSEDLADDDILADQVHLLQDDGTNLQCLTCGSGGGGGSTDWGDIGGTLSNQTDLQTALDAKQATITAGDGLTKTGNTLKLGGPLGAEVILTGANNLKMQFTNGQGIFSSDNNVNASGAMGRYWASTSSPSTTSSLVQVQAGTTASDVNENFVRFQLTSPTVEQEFLINRLGAFVNLTAGRLNLNADPTDALHAATKQYVDAKVEDNITNGATGTAPSENAVFDALALKQDIITASNGLTKTGVDVALGGTVTASTDLRLSANTGLSVSMSSRSNAAGVSIHNGVSSAVQGYAQLYAPDVALILDPNNNLTGTHPTPFYITGSYNLSYDAVRTFSGDREIPDKGYVDDKVEDNITDGATTTAPSENAVFDGLALKADDADLDSHTGNTSNPHSVTKTQVGLGNVDNTSDANKPVSTATQTALDAKQATLVSGTNIKTINGSSILGSGDLEISGGSDASRILLYKNSNVTPITGTTSETIMDSFLVPAGTLDGDDVLHLVVIFTKSGTAGTFNARFKFNTSESLTGATLFGNNGVPATNLYSPFERRVTFANSVSSQIVFNTGINGNTDMVGSTSAKTTLSQDFSQDQYIIISAQPSNAGDAITIETWQIELID